MADGTAIEWSDATWNIVTGCSIKSPGCTNCYAMKLAGTRMKHDPSRTGLTRDSNAGPVWTGEVRFNEQWLDQPLHWTRPRKIFVCAHGDLFHEAVPNEWIDRVFAVMGLRPWHVFQLLTKRPERMRAWFEQGLLKSRIAARLSELNPSFDFTAFQWPLPNVWLGTSVEDQARADERIPHLLATPAAVRWLSCEPLLGPVSLEEAWFGESALDSECWGDCAWCEKGHPPLHNCQKGQQTQAEFDKGRSGLDWIVVGGESGPGARPMHPDWARFLRDQCAAAGVPFLFKQWGEWRASYGHPSGTPGRFAMMARDDGAWASGNAVMIDHYPRQFTSFGSVVLERVGKKAAGRLLDGVLHDGFPA